MFNHPCSQGRLGDGSCVDPAGLSPGACSLLTLSDVQTQTLSGAFPSPPPNLWISFSLLFLCVSDMQGYPLPKEKGLAFRMMSCSWQPVQAI